MRGIHGVTLRTFPRRWVVLAGTAWLLGSACGPTSHDLEVINNWDRGVAVYVVSERAGLPDQQVQLGSIPAGATQRFAVQLVSGQDRVHIRYVYRSGIYEERADACIAGDEVRRPAVWRLVIPTGPRCQ